MSSVSPHAQNARKPVLAGEAVLYQRMVPPSHFVAGCSQTMSPADTLVETVLGEIFKTLKNSEKSDACTFLLYLLYDIYTFIITLRNN